MPVAIALIVIERWQCVCECGDSSGHSFGVNGMPDRHAINEFTWRTNSFELCIRFVLVYLLLFYRKCRLQTNAQFFFVVAAKGKKINRLCNSLDGNLNAPRFLSLFIFFTLFSCGGRLTSRGMSYVSSFQSACVLCILNISCYNNECFAAAS